MRTVLGGAALGFLCWILFMMFALRLDWYLLKLEEGAELPLLNRYPLAPLVAFVSVFVWRATRESAEIEE